MNHVFADLQLARRLEQTEGRGNAAFVDAQARFDPSSGAIWKTAGGTSVMFAGVGSPITQTFGLGIHEPLKETDLDAIERFFTSRGSAVFHEVCPLAGVEVFATLARRGYQPMELSSVLYQPIDADTRIPANPELTVRKVEQSEAAMYGKVSAQGWSEQPPELMPLYRRLREIERGLRNVLCRGARRASRSPPPRCSCTRARRCSPAPAPCRKAGARARKTRCSTRASGLRHPTGAIWR